MANIKSAKKRAKQTVVRNARNTSQRSMLRTAVKRVLKALEAQDAAAAEVAKQKQAKAEDRVAARYYAESKAKGKQVNPPQMPAAAPVAAAAPAAKAAPAPAKK